MRAARTLRRPSQINFTKRVKVFKGPSIRDRQIEFNKDFDYTTTLFYEKLAKCFPLTEKFFRDNHNPLTEKGVHGYGVHIITDDTRDCIKSYNRCLPKCKEHLIDKAFDKFKDDMGEATSLVRIIQGRYLGPRVIRKMLFSMTKDYYSNH